MKTAALVGLLMALFLTCVKHSPELATDRSGNLNTENKELDTSTLYTRKCSGCHGKDGHGLPAWRSLGQPDFADADWQKSVTDAQLMTSIANGKGEFMPAWKGKLSDAEIKALVATVRAFGGK